MEAVTSRTVFPPENRVKTDRLGQTPNPHASVSAVAPPVTSRNRPRLPTLPPSSLVCYRSQEPQVPSLHDLILTDSSATRRPARLESRLQRDTNLADTLAVGVCAADTCGRRFLLDLSGDLKSGTASGVLFNILQIKLLLQIEIHLFPRLCYVIGR